MDTIGTEGADGAQRTEAARIWALFNPDAERPASDVFLDLWSGRNELILDQAFASYPTKRDLDDCVDARPVPALLLRPDRVASHRIVWAWRAPSRVPGDNFRCAVDGAIFSYDRSEYFFLDGPLAELARLVADLRRDGARA